MEEQIEVPVEAGVVPQVVCREGRESERPGARTVLPEVVELGFEPGLARDGDVVKLDPIKPNLVNLLGMHARMFALKPTGCVSV